MRTSYRRLWLALLLFSCCGWMQQPSPSTTPGNPADREASVTKLKELLQANITTEWDAFKNRNKKAYNDLLADDFVAVEDDNQGMRTKAAAVSEIDRSVVNDYKLFAITVTPLDPHSALVTYELTLLFPPGAAVRFKRVMVSEIWIQRDGQWKERYYQETHVR